MGVDLGKTAKKAATNPLGAVGDLIGGVLGGGPSKNTIASREAREWGHRAMRGDVASVQLLKDALISRYPAKRRVATQYLVQLSNGRVEGYPDQPIAPAVRRAAQQAVTDLGLTGGTSWEGTTGTVPDAEPSSPAPETTKPGSSAPSAPRSASPSAPTKPPCRNGPRDSEGRCPCKYGARDADGRCPKASAASEIVSFAGGGAAPKKGRPCKYGERGPDGYCPKKQSTRMTKTQSAALTKASRAAERIVTAGVGGALKAIGAAMKAAGVTAAAATGTVLAVSAAALGGWMIGQGLLRLAAYMEPAERKKRASLDFKHAREALARQLGVYDPNIPGIGLTEAQLAPLKTAYANAIEAIEARAKNPLS